MLRKNCGFLNCDRLLNLLFGSNNCEMVFIERGVVKGFDRGNIIFGVIKMLEL